MNSVDYLKNNHILMLIPTYPVTMVTSMVDNHDQASSSVVTVTNVCVGLRLISDTGRKMYINILKVAMYPSESSLAGLVGFPIILCFTNYLFILCSS